MSNLDDAAFAAGYFTIHIILGHEGVKHLGHQRELVGNEWVVVDELPLILKFMIAGRQVKLGVKGILFAVIQFAQRYLTTAVLVENTLLCDILGVGALERYLDLETAHNLAIVLAGLVDITTLYHFAQILLGSAS